MSDDATWMVKRRSKFEVNAAYRSRWYWWLSCGPCAFNCDAYLSFITFCKSMLISVAHIYHTVVFVCGGDTWKRKWIFI